MKKAMEYLGAGLIVLGLIAMAGAGGDCDGECMEYANTLGETALYIVMGLTIAGLGGIIVYNQE